MILPIVNIIAGFILAAPKLKQWFAKQAIETAEGKLLKFRGTIGAVVLVLGIFGIIKRVTFMYDWSWHYGSSYSQAIIAILMGLLLSANLFSGKVSLHARIMVMNKYAEWIGLVGILIGLGALI